MKNIVTVIFVLSSCVLMGQRDLTPNKRKDAFGSRDFRKLNNYGLQFQLGPTWTMTRLNNKVYDVDFSIDSTRGAYYHDPKGRLGVYGEIGMFHFPKKRSKLSLMLKTVLVSYYDWGIGFKYFRGTENVHMDNTDAGGVVVSQEEDSYNFSNGNLYGRFSIHKNIKLSENWFLDNTLGINLDYRLLQTSDAYSWSPITNTSAYYKPFHVQMHYGLAASYRLKRGSYLIIGARTPILGYQSFTQNNDGSGNKDKTIGNPAFHWYSSRYWPILFHVKYMFLFEKKQKGCPPVDINEDDKERYRNGQ